MDVIFVLVPHSWLTLPGVAVRPDRRSCHTVLVGHCSRASIRDQYQSKASRIYPWTRDGGFVFSVLYSSCSRPVASVRCLPRRSRRSRLYYKQVFKAQIYHQSVVRLRYYVPSVWGLSTRTRRYMVCTTHRLCAIELLACRSGIRTKQKCDVSRQESHAAGPASAQRELNVILQLGEKPLSARQVDPL